MRYAAYLQWLADAQWTAARRAVAPFRLFGDLPFMVGADSADVWANDGAFSRDVTVGDAARRLQRTRVRTGACPPIAGTCRPTGLRLAARARAARHGALRRLPHRSRDWFLPHVGARRGGHGGLHADDEARPARAGPADPARLPGLRRVRHCRRPRHGSRLPARVARRRSACRATRCSAGSAPGTARASPSSTRASTRRSRWPRPARTTPRRWPNGGTPRRPPSARRCWRCQGSRGISAGGAPLTPEQPFDDGVRDALLTLLYTARLESRHPADAGHFRVDANASTRRPRSATPTGRGGCPGPSTPSSRGPTHRSAPRHCARGRSRRDAEQLPTTN